MRWITEENYAEQMRAEAEPYVAARTETGYDERVRFYPDFFSRLYFMEAVD